MGRADYYAPGDWNAICDICGQKYKASELRLNWQNLMVCPTDYEPRQPQDFVRGVADNPTPPWVRPQGADDFVPLCTPNGISAVPGYAEPGCAFPGYLSPAFNPDGDPY